MFAGKKIVVVGGNSGIGLATARAFTAEGGKVAIVGRNALTLEAATHELGAVGIRADVSVVKEIDAAVIAVRAQLGEIDVLFANAGIGAMVPFNEVSEDLWDGVMNVNLKGMYFTVQRFVPLMNASSAIVLCSSVGAVRSWPGSSVYSASKAAVNSLGRSFASELLPLGIRVNVVMPGGIDTPIMERSTGVGPAAAEDVKRGMAAHTPMKRMGTPEEVAAAVLFLCSPAAAYITGTELIVDGGVVGCAT